MRALRGFVEIETLRPFRESVTLSYSRVWPTSGHTDGSNPTTKSNMNQSHHHGPHDDDDQHQADLDNHADQLNPNNDAYWESRGEDERPDDWESGNR